MRSSAAGFRLWGLGPRLYKFGVSGFGFFKGLEFRVLAFGLFLGFRVQGFGVWAFFRV